MKWYTTKLITTYSQSFLSLLGYHNTHRFLIASWIINDLTNCSTLPWIYERKLIHHIDSFSRKNFSNSRNQVYEYIIFHTLQIQSSLPDKLVQVQKCISTVALCTYLGGFCSLVFAKWWYIYVAQIDNINSIISLSNIINSKKLSKVNLIL